MFSRILLISGLICAVAQAEDGVRIDVHPGEVQATLSPYFAGACIEDVNHEIYGGLYSQMLYGEHFQEAAPCPPLRGFQSHGGAWRVQEGELWAGPGQGPKLIHDSEALNTGTVGVEVRLPLNNSGGIAGLILAVSEPGEGADRFTGYELSLAPNNELVLGRHRQNWEPIGDYPCKTGWDTWIPLVVSFGPGFLDVTVNGEHITRYEDKEHPLDAGTFGLRTWQSEARFRNLWREKDGKREAIPFAAAGDEKEQVSGMWRPVWHGTAEGRFSLLPDGFQGRQSQRIEFTGGDGAIGIENEGLNRRGLHVTGGQPYEGCVWMRSEGATTCFAALENNDGSQILAETPLACIGGDWQRVSFNLSPSSDADHARFVLSLKQPGAVTVGYAFLQPGAWGRFKDLPVRKDVADFMKAQGLTVLRYGGSMVNAPEYRWKKMLGPRGERPPYKGFWYQYASNGWGIVDFVDFCEAGGFLGVPAFNMDETPQDMADFVEYMNGPVDSPWGRKRTEAGHPEPYHLKQIELGNEEAVDEAYWRRFEPMARALWEKDPGLILVVGDFAYGKPIEDPMHFDGAPLINSLSAHKKILDLAKAYRREVWFDVHVGTENPPDALGLGGVPSFIQALDKLSPGAKYRVAVFELNANNHAFRRALANAVAITELERLGGKIAVVCSANGLQPYKQNDNGWDQGLVFLSPSQVWGQPPYYIAQMISARYLPELIRATVSGDAKLVVNAQRDHEGKTVQVQVVNLEQKTVPARIALNGIAGGPSRLNVIEYAGPLDGINTSEDPERLVPSTRQVPVTPENGAYAYTFPPESFSILRFEEIR